MVTNTIKYVFQGFSMYFNSCVKARICGPILLLLQYPIHFCSPVLLTINLRGPSPRILKQESIKKNHNINKCDREILPIIFFHLQFTRIVFTSLNTAKKPEYSTCVRDAFQDLCRNDLACHAIFRRA